MGLSSIATCIANPLIAMRRSVRIYRRGGVRGTLRARIHTHTTKQIIKNDARGHIDSIHRVLVQDSGTGSDRIILRWHEPLYG